MGVRNLKSIQAKINGWFVEVRRPPITRDGIDDIVTAKTTTKTKKAKPTTSQIKTAITSVKKTKKSVDLDSLTKNIEELLDDSDFVDQDEFDDEASLASSQLQQEPKYFYHFVSQHDHETLFLDKSVGHCCMVNNSPPESDFIAIVQSDQQDRYFCNQNQQQTSDLSIITPTPPQHDYLSLQTANQRQHTKRRTTSDILFNETVKKYMEDDARTILSTTAISRFAKFSHKFQEFTIKQGV